MSETLEISMDLLELEDVEPRPTLKVFFLKRKVEKKSFPGKKMMWSGPRS